MRALSFKSWVLCRVQKTDVVLNWLVWVRGWPLSRVQAVYLVVVPLEDEFIHARVMFGRKYREPCRYQLLEATLPKPKPFGMPLRVVGGGTT